MPRVVDPRYNFQGYLLHKDCYLIMEREIYEKYEDCEEDHKTLDDMHGKWNVRMMDLTSNEVVAHLMSPENVAITGGLQYFNDNIIPFLSIFGDWLLTSKIMLIMMFICLYNSHHTGILPLNL